MALALYRKYRPRTFAEVIGQEHVTEPLSQALRSGRLHHAYLFSGPRGCGKTSSARILARSLNCEQGPTPEPCGVCASCRSLANDGTGSIDVIEIDAASHGGVDDARDLREKAFFAPAGSRYKIYVIDEAHMVSSAGFNALLKLVEEPPDYVKFIFATTEPEKVLGTIRSRTHHYPFRLIPPAVLRPYLQQLTEAEGIHVEPAVLPLVVRAGGGSARDSLSVLDQLIAGAGPDGVSYARAVALLGVTDVTLIDEMCAAIAAGDGAAAYSTIDRVAEAGHDPRRFASDLLERFRDLIILQQVPDAVAKGLIDGPADQLEEMSAQAGRLGPATLSRCADIVHNGLVEMRGTTAPRLLLELITARMLLPGADDSTGALLQRLERMERRLALGGDIPAVREESGGAAPVASTPVVAAGSAVASEPAVDGGESAGGGAPVGGGGGLSAARAAAAAASRRAAPPTAGRRSAASGSEPSAPQLASSEPSAPQPAVSEPSAPQSAVSETSGPEAAPASAVAAAQASSPAVPVSGESRAAVSVPAVGEPDIDDEEPPPWDDAPDYEHVAEQPRPVPAGRPAEPAPAVFAPAEPALAEPAPTPVSAAPASAPVRRSEPAGLLPDAPEERAAAAVADTPGQLTVSGVREVWPEVVAEVRKQPRGKVIGPMIADAVVRSLDGETVVLLHQHDWAAARITQESALVTNALYETLGGRWQIRCEVGNVEGGSGGGPSRGAARRPAPPEASRPAPPEAGRAPAHEPVPRAQTSTAPRAASGAQQAHAASARPPQARRQETESAGSSDDDWPEPVKPGGLGTAPPPDDEEEDWPEVRPIGVPSAGGLPSAGAAPSAGGSASAGGALSAGGSASAGGAGSAGGSASAGGVPLVSGALSDNGPLSRGDAGPGGAADLAVPGAASGPADGVVGGPARSSDGFPVAGVTSDHSDRNGTQNNEERAVAQSTNPAAPGAAGASPASVAPGVAGAPPASVARNAGPGSGLAAARAAAAGARAAATARQGGARPATPPGPPAAASSAWSDGSPAEEAPFDPEFDGPPRGEGSGYDGFDPGDEPLDEVIDEKTARESSEQQAMRLLQEVLGAEKIGES